MSEDAVLGNRSKSALPTAMACAALFAAVGQAAISGDFAGLVDIGAGRKMYLECRGTGSPTVVLVAGLKGSADDWSIAAPSKPTVFADVAKFTQVCAYDRPGTPVGEKPSRSDPVRQPTTAGDAVADLHALLSAAKVVRPLCAGRPLLRRPGRQAVCQHLSRRRIRSRPRRCSLRRASGCGDPCAVGDPAKADGGRDTRQPHPVSGPRKARPGPQLRPGPHRPAVASTPRGRSVRRPGRGTASPVDDRGGRAAGGRSAGLRLHHRCRAETGAGAARQAGAEREARHPHQQRP